MNCVKNYHEMEELHLTILSSCQKALIYFWKTPSVYFILLLLATVYCVVKYYNNDYYFR